MHAENGLERLQVTGSQEKHRWHVARVGPIGSQGMALATWPAPGDGPGGGRQHGSQLPGSWDGALF